MKILFLIDDLPIDAVNKWEEIKIYKDQGRLTPSKDFYAMVKALEQNEDFEKEILLARKNIKELPENGMSWQDYEKFEMDSLTVYSEEESKKYKDFFVSVKKEADRIKAKMKLDPYIASQLDKLIIGGFVYPQDFPITYGATPIDEGDLREGYGEVYIRITHPVAQNALVEYIKNTDNWRNINTLMKSLRPKPKYKISKRDMRILELRDIEKLSFKDIVERIAKEFSNEDKEGELNQGQLRTAYRRAKLTIKSSAKNI